MYFSSSPNGLISGFRDIGDGFAAPPRDFLETERSTEHRSRGGTLPYREAMEQTEQGAYEEYVRTCQGVTVTEHVDRSANSPRERVQILERVLAELPGVFRFKRDLDTRVTARSMTQAEATRQLTEKFQQLGYHPTYVPGTEAAELAKTRCALSRARWDFMAYQHRGSHPCNTTIDLTARSIIAAAQNRSVPIETRGVQNVRNILNAYYPNEVAKVSNVQWDASLNGLMTTSQSSPTATGLITVGRQFTDGTVEMHFARRVLQTGHELRHIDQQRAMMGGPARKAEREFLAHYWAATTPPKPGTGCMVKGTHVSVIDCSLSFRNCMTAADRAKYPGYEQKLLDLRSRLRPDTPWPPAAGMPACPPSGC
jgi:hypothetical protein